MKYRVRNLIYSGYKLPHKFAKFQNLAKKSFVWAISIKYWMILIIKVLTQPQTASIEAKIQLWVDF